MDTSQEPSNSSSDPYHQFDTFSGGQPQPSMILISQLPSKEGTTLHLSGEVHMQPIGSPGGTVDDNSGPVSSPDGTVSQNNRKATQIFEEDTDKEQSRDGVTPHNAPARIEVLDFPQEKSSAKRHSQSKLSSSQQQIADEQYYSNESSKLTIDAMVEDFSQGSPVPVRAEPEQPFSPIRKKDLQKSVERQSKVLTRGVTEIMKSPPSEEVGDYVSSSAPPNLLKVNPKFQGKRMNSNYVDVNTPSVQERIMEEEDSSHQTTFAKESNIARFNYDKIEKEVKRRSPNQSQDQIGEYDENLIQKKESSETSEDANLDFPLSANSKKTPRLKTSQDIIAHPELGLQTDSSLELSRLIEQRDSRSSEKNLLIIEGNVKHPLTSKNPERDRDKSPFVDDPITIHDHKHPQDKLQRAQTEDELNLPIGDPESRAPRGSVVSKKSMFEDFGNVDNIQRLQMALDKRRIKKNKLKKLYEYVHNIQEYKKETGLDNLAKVGVEFPNSQMLSIFTNEFRVFSDLPESVRKQIIQSLEPRQFTLQDRILKINQQIDNQSIHSSDDQLDLETGMYMICDGEVMILKNERMYKKFSQNEDQFATERKAKSQIADTFSFGAVAKVGWVITSYLLNNPKYTQIIEKSMKMQRREMLIKRFLQEAQSRISIGKGQTFGDFGLLRQRAYQPIYAISMHPETQILYLSKQKLRQILNVDPSNLKLLREQIPQICSNSSLIQKKICRCFEDVSFYPGQVIVQRGQRPKFAYLIRRGVCEIYSPMKEEKEDEDDSNVKFLQDFEQVQQQEEETKKEEKMDGRRWSQPQLSAAGQSDSHTDQGSLGRVGSTSMLDFDGEGPRPKEYKVLEISDNEWIGDEFILHDKLHNKNITHEKGRIFHTVKARTVVRALKISCMDMRRQIPKDYLKKMRDLAEIKQDNIGQVADKLKDGFTGLEEFNLSSKPFAKDLDCIKQQHPHLPLKMMVSISFGDGQTRKRHHVRNSSSLRVGEITLNENLQMMDQQIEFSKIIHTFQKSEVKKKVQFEVELSKLDELKDPSRIKKIQTEIERMIQLKWIQAQQQAKNVQTLKTQTTVEDAHSIETVSILNSARRQSSILRSPLALGSPPKSKQLSPNALELKINPRVDTSGRKNSKISQPSILDNLGSMTSQKSPLSPLKTSFKLSKRPPDDYFSAHGSQGRVPRASKESSQRLATRVRFSPMPKISDSGEPQKQPSGVLGMLEAKKRRLEKIKNLSLAEIDLEDIEALAKPMEFDYLKNSSSNFSKMFIQEQRGDLRYPQASSFKRSTINGFHQIVPSSYASSTNISPRLSQQGSKLGSSKLAQPSHFRGNSLKNRYMGNSGVVFASHAGNPFRQASTQRQSGIFDRSFQPHPLNQSQTLIDTEPLKALLSQSRDNLDYSGHQAPPPLNRRYRSTMKYKEDLDESLSDLQQERRQANSNNVSRIEQQEQPKQPQEVQRQIIPNQYSSKQLLADQLARLSSSKDLSTNLSRASRDYIDDQDYNRMSKFINIDRYIDQNLIAQTIQNWLVQDEISQEMQQQERAALTQLKSSTNSLPKIPSTTNRNKGGYISTDLPKKKRKLVLTTEKPSQKFLHQGASSFEAAQKKSSSVRNLPLQLQKQMSKQQSSAEGEIDFEKYFDQDIDMLKPKPALDQDVFGKGQLVVSDSTLTVTKRKIRARVPGQRSALEPKPEEPMWTIQKQQQILPYLPFLAHKEDKRSKAPKSGRKLTAKKKRASPAK